MRVRWGKKINNNNQKTNGMKHINVVREREGDTASCCRNICVACGEGTICVIKSLGLARFQPTLTLGPHGLPFLPSPALPSPPNQQQPQPPCSTLFVANLGQFVSDHELKDIFARSVVRTRQKNKNKKKTKKHD